METRRLPEGHGTAGSLEERAIFYKHYLGTPTAILFTDAEGNIIDANNAFLRLYGYTIEEIRGKNPRILKSGRQAPAVYRELWQALTTREPGSWSGELINRKKNGEEVAVFVTISSVYRSDGSLIGYVADTMDITGRKELESKLRTRNEELEKLNAFKNDLMSITSHDLKAPVSAIVGYAGILKEHFGRMPAKQIIDYLDKIIGQGDRMMSFINEVLDLRKIEEGRFALSPGRVRIDSLLNACAELNAAAGARRNISIAVDCRAKRRAAVIDRSKMEQVLNNLFSNAVKFSPEGGSIRVRYEDDGGGSVRISIEDDGPGIPEKDLPFVFDAYYQASSTKSLSARSFGTGLGLNIVKGIMELHRGSVTAHNLPMKGCRFVLEFPVKSIASPSCLAVLIIDPQGTISESIQPFLSEREIACFSAADRGEAQRVYDFEAPDIICVSDAALCEDVMEFLRDVKSEDKNCCLLQIREKDTASSPAIFTRTLTAPVTGGKLDEVLRHVLDAGRSAA